MTIADDVRALADWLDAHPGLHVQQVTAHCSTFGVDDWWSSVDELGDGADIKVQGSLVTCRLQIGEKVGVCVNGSASTLCTDVAPTLKPRPSEVIA